MCPFNLYLSVHLTLIWFGSRAQLHGPLSPAQRDHSHGGLTPGRYDDAGRLLSAEARLLTGMFAAEVIVCSILKKTTT